MKSRQDSQVPRRVRVLLNPNTGRNQSMEQVIHAFNRHWNAPDIDLAVQFSLDVTDGRTKARRAIDDGVDTILVVGGDGIVNTIGAELVGSSVALGVIPTGSGNGFARHFGVPLNVPEAVGAMVDADRCLIDVGTANGRPFLVTCSMAADASLVRTFETFPFRGIVPYVFAAAYELFEYQPQPFRAQIDGDEDIVFTNPLVFTVANLTQFGGGARIAPHAEADDGYLELVVIAKQDAARAVANVGRLFDGTLPTLPGVITKRFRKLLVRRQKPAVIQVDGELQESGPDVEVAVKARALTVLVPRRPAGATQSGAV